MGRKGFLFIRRSAGANVTHISATKGQFRVRLRLREARKPRVVRGLGAGLDEEALRLVRLMPWWQPGKIHGPPVWVSVTMPIVFRAL